jgi:hypothetical protein
MCPFNINIDSFNNEISTIIPMDYNPRKNVCELFDFKCTRKNDRNVDFQKVGQSGCNPRSCVTRLILAPKQIDC